MIVGVVSFGPDGCGTMDAKTNRGIYTNVTSQLDFIRSHTTDFSTKDVNSVDFLKIYVESSASQLLISFLICMISVLLIIVF